MPVPVYPVGGRIAFQTQRDGNGEIYMVGCDGSYPLNLSEHEAEDLHPSWSGNGLVAFASNRDSPPGSENSFDIYVLNVETKKVTRLTENEANDHSPALSILGDKVAFVSDREGNSEVYVLEITGGDPSNVSNDPSEDLDPSWSTGGNLLFSSNRDGNFDIYLKDVVGEGLLSITDVGRDDEDGINERWPDMVASEGEWRITYSSDRFGDWEIHSIDADGENIARATDHEDY